MSNSRGDKSTPGWNDPPNIEFNLSSPSSDIQRTKLNKRIAFPLSSSSQLNSSSVQTKHLTELPPTTSTQKADLDNKKEDSINSEDALEEVIKNFNQVINEMDNVELLQKKLDLLVDLWKSNRFPIDLQTNLVELSRLLMNHNYKDSQNLQIFLMTNYTNLCSSWMVFVRQIIYKKEKS